METHFHRYVAMRNLWRPLRSDEHVHHIDGDTTNNDWSNLEVLSASEHARIHLTKGRLCSISGCGRDHKAYGFCNLHYQRSKHEVPIDLAHGDRWWQRKSRYPDTCTIEDCDKVYFASGLCSLHYGRKRRGKL